MPSFERILSCFAAVWGMMTTRPDAVDDLDLSADGFWESFWAIIVAAPPLFVGWAAFAKLAEPATGMSRTSLFGAAGIMDIGAWLLPLAGFVLVASRAGIGDRMVHYVVSANWGGALLSWLLWPPQLLRLFAPDTERVDTLASTLDILLFIAALALSWRLTNAALAKGPTVASTVFVAMLAASFAVVFTIQGFVFSAA